MGNTVERTYPSGDIDLDTLDPGTVVLRDGSYYMIKGDDGRWTDLDDGTTGEYESYEDYDFKVLPKGTKITITVGG